MSNGQEDVGVTQSFLDAGRPDRVSRAPSWGSAEDLSGYIAQSVRQAPVLETPFIHATLRNIFPESIYEAILEGMPDTADYRAMSGRSKSAKLQDGTPTRYKIDLFPEYIRHFPARKRAIWFLVGSALRSRQVRSAFVDLLAPGLERRFGSDGRQVGLYPIPVLTRDIAGYAIGPHPDTHWKAITVQLYLPRDASVAHVGTVFHELSADGGLKRFSQLRFEPNSGYAFAVGSDTIHSVDRVGTEVLTRDSILLTYFLDKGPLRILRNRGKRAGNFLLNELRHAGTK